MKPQTSRREITKIRAEINDIETKRKNSRIDQWNWELVLWKINKIDKPLDRSWERERERDE